MPLLGAHMSIAGGLHLAFGRIKKVQGKTLQIFSRNQRQWAAPPISPESVVLFRKTWEENGLLPVAVHDSYLTNLAARAPAIAEKSVAAFAEELRRTALLGISLLITHPGSHLGDGVAAGLQRFVANLDRAINLSAVSNVRVLLETTAGQGSNLGSRFEQLAFIISRSQYGDRLGVCFDTCHCFAAGYDIRGTAVYQETFARFDRVIGLARLQFFHLNDSKTGLGSHIDRHEHIGKGQIGLEGFRLLVNDPRFQGHPMVLETPKGQSLTNDRKNLKVLCSLM
jgi:deoxyribonuclease IV